MNCYGVSKPALNAKIARKIFIFTLLSMKSKMFLKVHNYLYVAGLGSSTVLVLKYIFIST